MTKHKGTILPDQCYSYSGYNPNTFLLVVTIRQILHSTVAVLKHSYMYCLFEVRNPFLHICFKICWAFFAQQIGFGVQTGYSMHREMASRERSNKVYSSVTSMSNRQSTQCNIRQQALGYKNVNICSKRLSSSRVSIEGDALNWRSEKTFYSQIRTQSLHFPDLLAYRQITNTMKFISVNSFK